MYGYTRWLWKAQDYSSCIVLYPLQVGCHIICRTKQHWATVVNSWQSNSRYKCGSCSTCQESTNTCQTTLFKIACPSNILLGSTTLQPSYPYPTWLRPTPQSNEVVGCVEGRTWPSRDFITRATHLSRRCSCCSTTTTAPSTTTTAPTLQRCQRRCDVGDALFTRDFR